jgi:integrase
MEDVDYLWISAFDQYLAQTQSVNGRSIYLRALRAVCKYAERRGIASSPFKDYHIKAEATRKRSVPVELLRKLMNTSTTKRNERYRDYFFLMFYLIGINAKDLLLAKKSQVIDGRLEYTREKTRKKYSIKIEPEASELLSKYEGKGDYLLEAMDHCVHYKSFAREINEALKTIQDDTGIPIIPDLTTYFSRHCWATYACEIDIPIDTVSQALGHSFGNRTTLVYVKYDQKKVDEANRKVIDYLLAKTS